MNTRMPVAIRVKYGLVHVPSADRCRRWARRCREQLAAGLPPERAGLLAATDVFPYEAKEVVVEGALEVTALLDMDK